MSWTNFFEQNQSTLDSYDEIELKIKEFIRSGTDVNYKDLEGETPLHLASEKGYVTVVKILIDKRADVDIKDKWGRNPLHYASKIGHLDIVKILIDRGVDINVKDKWDRTALHYVSERGHLDTVKLLVEYGACLNSLDKDGNKPIDLSKNEEIKEYLSNAKQMMDKRDIHSYFWVMVYNHPSIKRKNKN